MARQPYPRQPVKPPVFGPSPIVASQVAVSATAVEIMVLIGMKRAMIDAETALPTGVQAIEWTACYSFSPTAADQLQQALGAALTQYRQQFGPIPVDQKMTMVQTLTGLNPV
jgi:hypothetical protein